MSLGFSPSFISQKKWKSDLFDYRIKIYGESIDVKGRASSNHRLLIPTIVTIFLLVGPLLLYLRKYFLDKDSAQCLWGFDWTRKHQSMSENIKQDSGEIQDLLIRTELFGYIQKPIIVLSQSQINNNETDRQQDPEINLPNPKREPKNIISSI